jgi:predicted DNA-binding transcriptional regulator YafY
MARYPGKPFKEPAFDPLLAVHRVQKLELTERSYQFPENYDFEKFFNQNFGVIKEEAFEVVVEFSGYAAEYVAERMWSPDQKLTRKKDGTVKLKFSASSEPELISWILSFGDKVKMIKPDWLIEEIRNIIDGIREVYL